MIKSFTLNEIEKIVHDLFEDITKKDKFSKTESSNFSKETFRETATIIALSGELGAGKTTLTQEIAKLLGVKEKVTSPTFVLIKRYETANKTFKNLVHIDAYRLENSEELIKIGWQELVENKENLIIIEWPERVPDCLKSPVYKVILGHRDEQTRTIKTFYN